MKVNIARTTLLVLFVAVVCMSMASTAQAQGHGCLYALAAGKAADSMSGTAGGVIVRATLNGTYTVNAACTGTLSFNSYDGQKNLLNPGTIALVWDDNMQEVRFVVTSLELADGTHFPVVVKGMGRSSFPKNSNEQRATGT